MSNLDGEPIWSPIKENDLKFAVNTNWDLFQHVPTSTFYLRHNTSWLKATDVKGPWWPAGTLPESFKKLPAEDNWKDVKANLPGKPIQAAAVPKSSSASQPAELILLDRRAGYRPVQGTQLQWVSNTESDVFRMGTDRIRSTTWWRADGSRRRTSLARGRSPRRPCQRTSRRFHSSTIGRVCLRRCRGPTRRQRRSCSRRFRRRLVSTRRKSKAPEVAFQGDPQFQPIEKTTVERAVNTDKDVFKVGDLYYMCYQGVWFSGKAASGPWQVAESVPEEIYQIPVSSPANHVTYVTIEDRHDDEWVTCRCCRRTPE